jgi:hypothetical protein
MMSNASMAVNLLPRILLLALVLLVGGCGENSDDRQSKVTSHATAIRSKAELDKLIVPGMTTAEVTNIFGIPDSQIQVKEGVAILTYSFPFATIIGEERLHLTGFTVNMRDGKVVNWSPITGEFRKSSQPGASQGLFGEQPFEIFLVTDSLTNMVSRVESEGSADASGVKISPDIAFKAKVFAGRSGTERSDEMTVILVVSDQDSAKLKELSENNLGKRTLVVCRKKVIAAPAITAAITSKQFTFTVKDSRVLESLGNK